MLQRHLFMVTGANGVVVITTKVGKYNLPLQLVMMLLLVFLLCHLKNIICQMLINIFKIGQIAGTGITDEEIAANKG